MIRGSIRLRLTVWYSSVLAIGFILFAVTIWLSFRHQLRSDLDSSVRAQADGMEQYLKIEERVNGSRLGREIDEYARSLPPDHLLAVFDPEYRPVYRSDGLDRSFAELAREFGPEGHPARVRLNGHSYRGLRRSVDFAEGGGYRYVVAVPSETVEHALRRLAVLLGTTIPAFIVLAAIGGYWLSRRALRPVDRMTEEARLIGVHNLSERLPVSKANDEIARLAKAWNEMLGRIEGAVSRIAQFTADASHELRTPIAIIRFAAERALRRTRSEAEYRGVLLEIQNESERMTQLVEDLLFLARADEGPALDNAEPVELNGLVASACAEFEPLAQAREIRLSRTAASEPVWCFGNPLALRRMVRILLDNAIKYTPAGGSVSVVLTNEDGRSTLTVNDTGIGIPDEAKRKIFERFYRVDTSRNKETGGYGLGLSIAQTIAQQHHASIEVLDKKGPGAAISIQLPTTV